MEDSIKEIVKNFGLDMKKYIFFNCGYVINTDRGTFFLKKLNYDVSRLLFLHGAKEYLAKQGFFYTDRYVVSKRGPYVKYNGNIYIMTKWINGKKCSCFDASKIKEAARSLANIHNASRGYIPPKKSQWSSNLGKWQEIFLARCEDFIYIKNLVKMKSKQNQIDFIFLENVERAYNMALESVKMLQKNGYFELVKKEGKIRFLCHNNYNLDNIIIDNNQIYVVNFDYCKFELRCFDIASFIVSNIIKFNWSFDIALQIIESYNDIRSINKEEFKIMISIFQFPERFWRLANWYYYGKYTLNDISYYIKFKKAANDMELQMRFLEQYYKKFV